MFIGKTFRFEASHRLEGWPESHKCHNLHGHSYKVEVRFCGPVDRNTGAIFDFKYISDSWKNIFPRLDHHHLNDVLNTPNPTAEYLAEWIAAAFRTNGPYGASRLTNVKVWETEDAYAEYLA